MKPLHAVILATLFLSGCASNPFGKFYVDYTKSASPESLLKALPYSGSTMVYRTAQHAADVQNMQARGYLCLGEANFWATVTVTEAMLRKQAQEVGADVVLYSSNYAGTTEVTVNVPYFEPGTTSTTSTTGTVNANVTGTGGMAYGTANYHGTSTTTTAGTIHFVPQRQTREKYDHAATFWRKQKAPILGVHYGPLPDDMRRALGRNTGVMVAIVMDDTPAFTANILRGDLIVGIDGETVASPADLSAKLVRSAGKKVVLQVIRDGKTVEIPVLLNPAS